MKAADDKGNDTFSAEGQDDDSRVGQKYRVSHLPYLITHTRKR